MTLSKSRYCMGMQCPKMLWMDINMPSRFDPSASDETRLETGNIVSELAKGYFGNFIEVPFSHNKSEMIEKTRQLMDEGTRIIAEASFEYEGNFCSADILKAVSGGYELIEIKSSSDSDESSKIKSVYLDDMAYQTYILTHCGIVVKKVSILQLNRDYVRHGELNIQELFVLTDCTETIFSMQQDVARHISEISAIAKQPNEPNTAVGSHCHKPYDCGYRRWCFQNLPKNNVFEIGWGMWGSKKDEAYSIGLVTFEDILNSDVKHKLTEKQTRQITAATQNLPPHIDKKAISDFLSKIKYPLYYLDFETFPQPIPEWDNVSPYTQIPFQYSLHIQDTPRGTERHKEFLAKEGIDPRRPLADHLCADIPKNACVIAYNMAFEKGRIKELAALFPDLSDHLMSIHDNMIDLIIPFQSGAYYCKEMGGSYSIKSVLPALCPNDPKLDYNALNLIHNGSDAMNAYAALVNKSPEEIAKIRAALLAYCRLDTLAMVKILEKLYDVAGK